ncbi:MAG: VWA domain-containing protein [Bacteroidetes bacterium]|nr:VWA domain-containing protein [Bacteroidota bacterium]
MKNLFSQISNLRSLIFHLFLSCLLVPASCLTSSAQKQKKEKDDATLTRIEFLFDASQSMYGKWQTGTKIEVAKKLMTQLLDSLRKLDNIELALRVYGHQKPFPPQDCDDTRLEVPFGKNNVTKIQEVLKGLSPKGTTPIARSLELCANDFPQSKSRNIIILVTDGIEECKGDPCAVSLALQKKGVALKPFVIGMGLDESLKKTFDCVGRYYDATSEETFREALNVVISQALNNTTMQVNLLDANNKPTETNVDMTFYDTFGNIRYNFIHTINSHGNPDTLTIDPLATYKVVVHTIPPVSKDSITLTPGKHTIVGIDAPQGYLNLKFEGMPEYKKLQTIIRKHNDMKTLVVQDFNTTEKYIIGKYDLEILTLPRINLPDVDIAQSKTTTIQIPQPGIATFIMNGPGYGGIFMEEKNEMKLVYSLDENSTKETVVMQPGNYHVVFRPRNSKESIYTIERKFSITSGDSKVVVLN